MPSLLFCTRRADLMPTICIADNVQAVHCERKPIREGNVFYVLDLEDMMAKFVPGEVRSQKSEVRSQKSEVRSQKSEVRSQKSR
jgi:hypothetical protein